MQVTLPDGAPLELPDGATGADAASAIGPGLARAALAVRDNGAVRDLSAPLREAQEIRILTKRDGDDALELIRHDAAHVLATAVLELFPGVKISIGPPIQDGFYYDFEFPPGVSLSEDDLPRIEERMREHIKADEPFVREDVTTPEALERFRAEGQQYKVELIEDLVRDDGVDSVSLYTNGPFTDLCRGPHAPSTGRIGAIKLLSVAGAYWRGDASRQMLTRVYGTAFFTQSELDEHLRRLEEARARDAQELDGADATGGRGMRASAQVGEGPVRVERDGVHAVVADEILDQLHLVRLVLGPEALQRLLRRDVLAQERLVGLDVLAHALLDARQVVLGQADPGRELEVVVEAVVDRRADRDLHSREELQHRRREHVRGVVADELERIVPVALRQDADLLGVAQRRGEVAQGAVVAQREGRTRKAGADGARGVGARRALGKVQGRAVGEGDLHIAGGMYLGGPPPAANYDFGHVR